tara:strand:- start:6792 stop:7589 length:798 start_codon:yes stop_codon:yes gene_type:complete
MENITVIIPTHKIDEKFNDYFINCIKSLKTQTSVPSNILIVRSKDDKLKNYLENFDFDNLTVEIVENTGETDYMSQVNFGASKVKTKWFSILEYDDEYSNIWFNNVEKYSAHYKDVDIFLPLVVDVTEEGEFINFTNEAVWAMNFSDKMGYLDNACLLRYPNFQTSGLVINKEKYDEIGGFKPSMKLTFVYELLLRATYNDIKIFTIPKVGYKHTNMRSGSLFWDYRYDDNKKISSEEAGFWIESAKKEYFFTTDRGIKYEPETI